MDSKLASLFSNRTTKVTANIGFINFGYLILFDRTAYLSDLQVGLMTEDEFQAIALLNVMPGKLDPVVINEHNLNKLVIGIF